MEQEKRDHNKAIDKEREDLDDTVVGGVIFNVIAGIIMPASLFVTLPLSFAAIGESAEKTRAAVEGEHPPLFDATALVNSLTGKKELIKICDESSGQLDAASEKFDVLIQQTTKLVEWWDKVDQSLATVERNVKLLRANNISARIPRIHQAQEALSSLSGQFSNYSTVVSRPCL
jgi:hypothetical protein